MSQPGPSPNLIGGPHRRAFRITARGTMAPLRRWGDGSTRALVFVSVRRFLVFLARSLEAAPELGTAGHQIPQYEHGVSSAQVLMFPDLSVFANLAAHMSHNLRVLLLRRTSEPEKLTVQGQEPCRIASSRTRPSSQDRAPSSPEPSRHWSSTPTARPRAPDRLFSQNTRGAAVHPAILVWAD